MTISIDTTTMDIDHDTLPSARSDSVKSESIKSETTQPSSIDECNFPEQAPVSPFRKYLKQEHRGVLQLQEAVATTLFNASPNTLLSFVDPMVTNFKAVFKRDKQLVIWRKGNAAFIGIFEHHTSMKVFGFEHLVGFAIGYDGSWQIIKGAGNAFCEPKWSAVWTGEYRCFGGVNKMVAEYENMKVEKVQRASVLAESMLEERFWECKADIKAT